MALDGKQGGEWMAPTMDLHIAFQQPPQRSEWLLPDVHAPLSASGLVAANGTVWSEDGRLLATAIQQMMFRNVAPFPPPVSATEVSGSKADDAVPASG